MSFAGFWSELSFSYIGALIALAAYQEASGNAELSMLNKMWLQKGRNQVTSTRPQRIGSLLGYLMTAPTCAFLSAYIVGAMEKDIFTEGFTTVKFTTVKHDHNKITLAVFFFWMLSMLAILYGKWKILQPTPVAKRCISALEAVLGG